MAHGLGVGGKRAHAEDRFERVMLGLPREVDNGGGRGGTWRHCKLRITSSAVCRDGVRSPQAQGDAVGATDQQVMLPEVCSQTVHPEGVLSGWIGQNHVRII